MTKDDLIEIYRETIMVCQDNGYKNSKGEFVYLSSCNGRRGWLQPGVATTGLIYDETDAAQEKVTVDTEISVVNMDTVLAGEQLLKDCYNPAILNMASKWRPGGGVERGTTAQEESLFRRSNLCLTLEPLKNYYYPICHDDFAIYCPNTKFFRGLEAEGCPFLEKAINLPVITIPAMKLERHERNNPPANWQQVMKVKIMKILDAALEFGHDSLVLGAFGCGAYNNPNRKVAELFKDVLANGIYANRLRKVIFAVMDRHPEDQNGNFAVFKEVIEK